MNRFLTALITLLVLTWVATAAPLRNEKRGLGNFTNCDTPLPITITDLTFVPNPIVPNKDVAISVAGSSTASIEEGSLLNLLAILEGTPVPLPSIDICKFLKKKGVKCPIPAGPLKFDFSLPVPGSVALVKTLGLNITLTDASTKETMCLTGTVAVQQ